MTAFLIVAAILILAAGATFVFRRRTGGGGLEGVHGFRRHMDALSSEARRDVIGRLQSPDPSGGERRHTQRIAGQPGVGGRMNTDINESFSSHPFDGEAATADAEVEHDNNGEGTEAKG